VSSDVRQDSESPATRTVAFGSWVIACGTSLGEQLDFLGATLIGLGRLLRGRSHEARSRFTVALREAGMGSLPVVALIGFVAGLVLTLLASKELHKLGVEVGVPRLVGVVTLRELSALIVGIALAGRVASSYAAEIASANANGETDALRASGLDPVHVQAAPRVLALLLAGPVLLAYANLLAIVGSVAYATGSAGAAREHVAAMLSALTLKHAMAGLVKAGAFGFVVGLTGCFHGLRSPGTPAAVGRAVRRAVVSAVVGIGLAEVVLIFVFKWIRL
jgi:phospholipid/cholesterol/gamma-HCH transport system permease protein